MNDTNYSATVDELDSTSYELYDSLYELVDIIVDIIVYVTVMLPSFAEMLF